MTDVLKRRLEEVMRQGLSVKQKIKEEIKKTKLILDQVRACAVRGEREGSGCGSRKAGTSSQTNVFERPRRHVAFAGAAGRK